MNNDLETERQIRLCGSGGQGLVMAAGVLAQAGFRDKKFIALSSGYGSQVRGGVTRSDVVFAESLIDFPLVTKIDFLITMLQEAYDESLPLLKADGKIILDGKLVKPRLDSPIRCYSLPAVETAIRELKNGLFANIILLAAANTIGRLVSTESLGEAIRATVPPGLVDINLKALQLGIDLARKLSMT
jgi:2-oxoglutarate ferredoxin oxidoreductase subunit gamma